MSQLRHHQVELDRLALNVALVTFQGLALAAVYVRETQFPWPILVDQSLSLYKAYGIERGSRWEVLGPASWKIYGRLLLRGRRLKRPAGDIYQLGGDVLIDPAGIVRLHHIGRGPADRPPVDSLLQVVRQDA